MAWIDQRGSTVLPRNECIRLLALHAGGIGRVGVVTSGPPVIMPVNYRMLGEDVVIRIGRGTMLDAASRRSVLAFEVDNALPPDAWSVYVRGPARIVEHLSALAHARPARVLAIVPQPGTVDVVIRSDVVSGRRFAMEVPPRDIAALPGQELGTLGLRRPVRVPGDATIREAATAMEVAQTSSVVLGDHPLWLVSEHDLIGALAAGLEPESAARDVATRAPLWVTTTSTVEDAAALMAKHCVEHVLVITAEGELVSVLSRREAVRRLLRERDQSPPPAVTSEGAAQSV